MRNSDKKVSTKGLAKLHDFSQYPSGFDTWFRSYIQASLRKEIDFTLTTNHAYCLSQGACVYCNREGVSNTMGFRSVGIDRIDNSKGYIKSNVQPCCRDCNSMKSRKTHEEFIDHLRCIAKVLF